MTRRASGFEGRADPTWAFFHGDTDEDDPSFESIAQLAKRMNLSICTVQRKVGQAAEKWEVRVVRRPGIKCPVRVYRFKGAP